MEIRGIRKEFATGGLWRRGEPVVAAADVSFQLYQGESVALVGESGSGKSTIGRLLLRLDRPDDGEILLDGANVLKSEPRHASLGYRRRVQMVFQDPFGSLNPVHSVAYHLERPLIRQGRAGSLNPARSVAHHIERPLVRQGQARAGARERVLELLTTVGLEPAEDFIDRHPYELSGGQRQRVAIARALAVDPDVLVADEPTSMLDVSIRMGILNLLAKLKRERQLAILLITHDLAAARYLADRIMVLFRGRIVETGPSESIVNNPSHPYTRALLDAIADARAERLPAKSTTPGGERRRTTGCAFAPRCPDVLDECWTEQPASRPVEDRHVRCHLYPEGDRASLEHR